MAVTSSTRLGITRWSAGTDPFGRAQLDGDHATLDAKVAIYGQGTLATRPAPGVAGRFYWATDGAASTTLTYDNGTAWGSHPHAIADLPVAASGSSSATQLVRADDSRLSNARTPTAHTHAAADINSGTLDIARLPVATSGTSSATQVVRADDSRLSNARTPTAHTHGVGDLTATGTRDATTFLRGDNTWAVVESGAKVQAAEPTLAEGGLWWDSDEPEVSPFGNTATTVVEHLGVVVETHSRSTTNTYTNGKLTQVVEKDGATTVRTTTLTYTGDNLTQTVEVAGGRTVTTTFAYTGSELTGTTRSVV